MCTKILQTDMRQRLCEVFTSFPWLRSWSSPKLLWRTYWHEKNCTLQAPTSGVTGTNLTFALLSYSLGWSHLARGFLSGTFWNVICLRSKTRLRSLIISLPVSCSDKSHSRSCGKIWRYLQRCAVQSPSRTGKLVTCNLVGEETYFRGQFHHRTIKFMQYSDNYVRLKLIADKEAMVVIILVFVIDHVLVVLKRQLTQPNNQPVSISNWWSSYVGSVVGQ